MFFSNKKILVVVSHPDDEILGCGGTIAKLIKNNNKVNVYFTHEGSTSRYSDPKTNVAKKEIQKRERMALKASKFLKYKIIYFGKNQNLRNEDYSLLNNTKILSQIINKLKPEIIFTHHDKDMNEDHLFTHKTVINAIRPPSLHLVKEVYFMEIPSSTDWSLRSDFRPNLFINIESFISLKIQALRLYNTEFQKFPHSRSSINLKSHSIYRGAQVGQKNIEAFEVYRIIK